MLNDQTNIAVQYDPSYRSDCGSFRSDKGTTRCVETTPRGRSLLFMETKAVPIRRRAATIGAVARRAGCGEGILAPDAQAEDEAAHA